MATAKMPDKEQLGVALVDYRKALEKVYERQSETYDKTIVTLSGGALALSITFVHEIVKSPLPETLWLLATAWGAFACSILASLVSLLTSQWALRKAMCQVDLNTIHVERPGAWRSWLTSFLNIAACLMFILGVALIASFCFKNLALVSHESAPGIT
jgi:nitrate reductase NapE component